MSKVEGLIASATTRLLVHELSLGENSNATKNEDKSSLPIVELSTPAGMPITCLDWSNNSNTIIR